MPKFLSAAKCGPYRLATEPSSPQFAVYSTGVPYFGVNLVIVTGWGKPLIHSRASAISGASVLESPAPTSYG